MSFFPKPRPAFDLEIYDYLIEKGYPFILRNFSENCYLFLGDENHIVITPYKFEYIAEVPYDIYYDYDYPSFDSSRYLPIANIFLYITKDGCYLRLFFEGIYDDCLKNIVSTIARDLYPVSNFSLNFYNLELNVSDWKTAIDYFYDTIVPIIDNRLRELKSEYPKCQKSINRLKITDEEFKKYILTFKDAIEDCKTKLNNRNKLSKKHPLNLILYGPPGTGKTYNAITYAVAIIENLLIEEVLEEPREEVLKRYKEYLNSGQIVFTTFHPSYSYEDFIEGLKAKVENGQVQYYVEDGIFKEIVKRAKENPDKNYVIIIDEINRGNIPSIFGELITLIEEDKREGMPNAITVKLPYSKEDFSIPSNLYILGTMNTADRSIALLDIALRRRFEFVELMPRPDLLKDIKVFDDDNNPLGIDLEKLLECLNKRIEKELDRNKTIGHAYFLSFANQNQLALADLNKIFKNKIIPLLQEYFYDDWDKIREILNDNDGQFIQKDKSRISSKLNELSLPPEAFINIYQNCENAGNNQV